MEGQYVGYTFFRVDPAWRRLPIEERAAGKDAFGEVVEDWATRMDSLRTYSVGGVRPDSDFFLWKITQRYEDLGELGAALNGTPLAGWLETPYSYLATTKASDYTKARRARRVIPKGSPYLVVYPFVKIRPWYALPPDERVAFMKKYKTKVVVQHGVVMKDFVAVPPGLLARTAELKKYLAISRGFANQLGTKQTSTRSRSAITKRGRQG